MMLLSTECIHASNLASVHLAYNVGSKCILNLYRVSIFTFALQIREYVVAGGSTVNPNRASADFWRKERRFIC